MHPDIRSSKAGRNGTKINYTCKEQALPDPPKEAKEAHDWVIREMLLPGGSRRTDRNWCIFQDKKPKFRREDAHLLLHNICTNKRFCFEPSNHHLQCWLFYRRPQINHQCLLRESIARKSLLVEKNNAVERLWNKSTSLVPEIERVHEIETSKKALTENRLTISETSEAIGRMQHMYKSGFAPIHKCNETKHKKCRHRLSKETMDDIEEVLHLKDDIVEVEIAAPSVPVIPPPPQ